MRANALSTAIISGRTLEDSACVDAGCADADAEATVTVPSCRGANGACFTSQAHSPADGKRISAT
jgi:hypothetical protein